MSTLFPEIVNIQHGSVAYLRHLVTRLRQNAIVCIPSLGARGEKFAPIEFLGDHHYFATGAVSLARASGAALIPICCFRDRDDTQRLVLDPPIAVASEAQGDAGLVEILTTYARLLESYVQSYPGQWHRWMRGRSPAERFLDRSIRVVAHTEAPSVEARDVAG